MRKSERDVIVPGSGIPAHRSFGRTAGRPDCDVVASTADPEIGLDKARALSKSKVSPPVRLRALEWRRSLHIV